VSQHPPILVRFEGLQKSFGGQTVLDGISGEIRQGEVILLRGENGSGKTTLLNILTGCLEPDRGTIEFSPRGDEKKEAFYFPRAWHQELNPFQHFTPERVARLGIGRTWQDIRLFASLDLADNIAAASTDSDDSPWAALFRSHQHREISNQNRLTASNSLAALGLTGRDDSSADKISLGQSKRVVIARALQAKARILFLDEPLSGLDAVGIRDVLTHLRTLATDQGLSLVIIEHVLNIPRLLDFVTTVWTLKSGHLTESLPKSVLRELATTRAASDIHTLIRQALKREVPITTQALPQGADLTTYWLTSQDVVQTQEHVLKIENLTLQRGQNRLFADATDNSSSGLTLRLQRGTLNVLEAPNGWGKTSLMKRIIGFLNQAAGTVTLNGTSLPDIATTPVFHTAGGRALMSEVTLFPSLTLAETATLARISPRDNVQHRYASSLSGGESRKLGIECLGTSSLLMMDEFFHGLDSVHSTTALDHLLAHSAERTLLFLQPSAPAMSEMKSKT
jgi:ABC-type branched-subunit amino acid transport system ATPase component